MKFSIFCLAASLAVVCAGVEPRLRSPGQLQKRSIDWTNPQKEADKVYGDGTLTIHYLPGQQPIQLPSQQVIQQPVYQPPTTTTDPMCPQGKAGPCRELPLGQDGSIQVRCDGLVTLQFFLEYRVRGQKIKRESGLITVTLRKTIDIPSDAEDIKLDVQGVGWFGVTSNILTRQFKYPVIRCYSSIDAQNVKEVGCH